MSTVLVLLNTSFLLSLLGLSFHRIHLILIYLNTNTPTIAIIPILLLAISAFETARGLTLLLSFVPSTRQLFYYLIHQLNICDLIVSSY
uniref:NADH dehydrogenase subunit 4L n=1 Tax=Podarcis muralis TaxID=64176 RepID=A0A670IDR6_PODMU